jgi:hypothetical protein
MLQNGSEMLALVTILACTTLPVYCSLLDPGHVQREWGNVLIARPSGELLLPISSTTLSNMEGPSTPKHPRVTSIQHDSDLGRTPSYPAHHYSSSTNISDAKTNLKTILATRVSFNDPNIVDVLIKPDEVSDHFVKTVKNYILEHRVIMDFLTGVRTQTVQLERDMYKPLVGHHRYPSFEYSWFE